jgi:hypothetical protein
VDEGVEHVALGLRHSRLEQVGDDLGIGLGLERPAGVEHLLRRARKFSMMPLWMTAIRPVAPEVGMRVLAGDAAVGRPSAVWPNGDVGVREIDRGAGDLARLLVDGDLVRATRPRRPHES